MLILWIVSLVVICTFLIVVEYFHERISKKVALADMSREELYTLMNDELRQEFMAFAPIDKILLDKKTEEAVDEAADEAELPEMDTAVLDSSFEAGETDGLGETAELSAADETVELGSADADATVELGGTETPEDSSKGGEA
jgi:hypothetical protein